MRDNVKIFFENIRSFIDEKLKIKHTPRLIFDTISLQDKSVISFQEISSWWKEEYISGLYEKDRVLLFVLKQIARGNYYICNSMDCYIKMDSSLVNADYVQLSKDDILTNKLLEMMDHIVSKEDPERAILKGSNKRKVMKCMQFVGDDPDDVQNMDIISFLYGHKRNVLVKGSDYPEALYAKLYFEEKPSTEIEKLRTSKFAVYIDYREQLKHQSGNNRTIHDEKNVCGIWAFDASNIVEYLSEGCYEQNNGKILEHYGTRLFLLNMLPEIEYYRGNIEVIGPEFRVVKDYDLFNESDLANLDIFLHGKQTDFSRRMIRESHLAIKQKKSNNQN